MTAAVPLFDRDGWWDPDCRAFASLRATSVLRLQLLRQWLPGHQLTGTVVDLGCGGGLLAAPLGLAGARVLGVDVAPRALAAARAAGGGTLRLAVGDLAALPLAAGCADVVLLADVLEHVPAPGELVAAAARLLRQGGHLFVNTINRTWRARLLAIWLGEGLGFIPAGTHRHDWFVRPDELDAMAAAAGLQRVQRCGEAPRLLATLRQRAVVLRPSRDLAVGYAALYRREAA